MRCPYCDYPESKVLDSRPFDEGEKIKRRRECISCGMRFTTFEIIERTPVVVIKRDGSRQVFDPNKLLGGMIRACEKRPVTLEKLNNAIYDIEKNLTSMPLREVTSVDLGEMALAKLRSIDEIAYVRFASVYRDFNDIQSFMDELNRLQSEK